MAEEWVSIRVGLSGDPKVIAMADFLASQPDFADCIFRNAESVTACYSLVRHSVFIGLCLEGLIRVWGMVNERGYCEGNDFVLDHATLATIDKTSRLPHFGEAMASVSWAAQETRAGDQVVRFPNFADYNFNQEDRIDRDEKRRRKNAERQKRWRERQKSVQKVTPQKSVTGAPRNNENNAPKAKQSKAKETTATASAQCIDRGMQGGKVSRAEITAPKPQAKFATRAIPGTFQETLDDIVAILRLDGGGDKFLDQVGFLAKVAWADSEGFDFPAPIWDYVGQCKQKANPAGYLHEILRSNLGPDRWERFTEDYPSPAHCQWVLRKLAAGAIHEGGGP